MKSSCPISHHNKFCGKQINLVADERMEEFVETLAASRDPSTFYQLANDEGMSTQIFDVNPYENHPELTQTEAEVLWEYAKLNQRLKIVSVLTPSLAFFLSEPISFTR